MTLHRHGVSRSAILAALAERLEAEYREAMEPASRGDGSPRERLEGVLNAHCAVADSNLAVIEALDDATRDEVFHEGTMTRDAFVEPLVRVLRDCGVDDPVEQATVIFNVVGHGYRHLRTGHGWSHERARDAVVRLALDGA
jgi:hypothetical protein